MLQSYSEDAGSRKGSGDKALKMESSELSPVKKFTARLACLPRLPEPCASETGFVAMLGASCPARRCLGAGLKEHHRGAGRVP